MTQNRNVPFKSDFTPDELIRLLTLFEWDATEGLWWRHYEDKLIFLVNCSDVFAWGTADCEEVQPSDIEELEHAFDDAIQVAPNEGDIYFHELWAARKRKERPQGAYLNNISPELQELFLAAGPERQVDIMNPRPVVQEN